MPKSSPYYPNKALTYGQLFFFIKSKTFSVNPFDKAALNEGKRLILQEAKSASPTNHMFMKAAMLATGFSKRTITDILKNKE